MWSPPPLSALHAFVSQFQEFPHGGRYGLIESLQVDDTTVLSLHADPHASLRSLSAELDQAHAG